ncbi:MAG: hypothetical protein AVDCRST_MAG37-2028, partial [uncultured Rubrobacteraceae bacterium]
CGRRLKTRRAISAPQLARPELGTPPPRYERGEASVGSPSA